VTPDYFHDEGIRVLKRPSVLRTATENNTAGSDVDEKLAREYWPMKRRLESASGWVAQPAKRVVGDRRVVRSVKNRRLDEDAKFYVYQPFSQWAPRETSVVMRTQ